MRYLIPLDGSEAAARAARHVAATAPAGSEAVLLSLGPALPTHVARCLPRRTRDAHRAQLADGRFREPLEILRAAGIRVGTRVCTGADAAAIADAARAEHVDEVVLGVRRAPAWLAAFGSLAQALLDRSPVPVAIVPSGRPSLLMRFGVPAGAVGLTALVLAAE